MGPARRSIRCICNLCIRISDFTRSYVRSETLRQQYTVAGKEPVFINPQDANARGIRNGDVVRVFNARGQVLAGAVVSDRYAPGVARIHEGAWYDQIKAASTVRCANTVTLTC